MAESKTIANCLLIVTLCKLAETNIDLNQMMF